MPEIFILLVTFFEQNPEIMKTEGLFRISASLDRVDDLQIHIQMGNYYKLRLMNEDPHVVSNFLKKVLKFMGEPLATYRLYHKFRDLSGKKELGVFRHLILFVDLKGEKKLERIKEVCE